MKTYSGVRGMLGVSVWVSDEGGRRPLDPRLDLASHSPTGFEWGYGGSGPAQLALALLADATGDDAMALEREEQFKWAVVADLGGARRDGVRAGPWTLTEEQIRTWAAAHPLPLMQRDWAEEEIRARAELQRRWAREDL